jgi:hypothetical protein
MGLAHSGSSVAHSVSANPLAESDILMSKHDQVGDVPLIPANMVQDMITAAVRSALETVAARQPSARPNAEETMRLMKAELAPKTTKVIEVLPCRSPLTTSDFKAEVQDGVVTTLLDYKEPEGARVSVKLGGLIPEGVQHEKHWTYENFFQRDLRAYVGKPVSALLGTGSALLPAAENPAP